MDCNESPVPDYLGGDYRGNGCGGKESNKVKENKAYCEENGTVYADGRGTT